MSKKRFRLATLGCRTNQYETQAYRDQLLELGYFEAEEDEEADLCIVNTCTVTESADRSSRHQIRQLIRQNPGAKIMVTGCLAERRPDLIEKIGGVSAVVPNKEKEGLVASLFPEREVPEFSIKHFEAHTRAFVKVQDGCNSFCTYCIIPYVRGRSRSRPVEDVVREVEDLVASGYKDIVITGINVGDYEGGLAALMRAVDGVEGLKRLRLSSIDPDEVDDELMDAVLNGKHTCHSLHIVLQSGSNVVLKRMNRKYTRQIFFEAVEKLRRASPDFTFTTDVIVGFPGESDADFEETLEVMREVQFAKVHMFPYSRRERTRAALYPNQVPQPVVDARKAKVLQVAEEEAFRLREKYVGRTLPVLTESNQNGHTENFLHVLFPEGELAPNWLVDAYLVKNTPEGLIGAVHSHRS
ncbi:MAG: tRNA (N(6)-L-threonylcarbamoyladenosine(37)-C(2))-methylthiotransferase MtaB [Chlamydiales bacterium]|nr:tRNA (N(6)-L-threonylcarbamoyladenosine(37)-C(2))-methylthiotransferase MtaB [Chlamydiales bacterium]